MGKCCRGISLGFDAVGWGFSVCSISGKRSVSGRVPRQVDSSLELVMVEDSEIVDRLPLGEYIARSGYDWAAEDLADVSVALDLEMQQVMITVSGWDGVVVMDIVI